MVPSSTFGLPATMIEVTVEGEDRSMGPIIGDACAMVEDHTKMEGGHVWDVRCVENTVGRRASNHSTHPPTVPRVPRQCRLRGQRM